MALIVLFALLSFAAALPSHHKGRIFGGTDAVPGEFPYAAAINDVDVQFCDGVIINSQWVLTTAQCVQYLPEAAVVVAGSVSISNGTIFNISQTIAHEDFDYWTYQNDVGLIQIEGEFTFDANLMSIDIGEVEDGQTCTVLGWGTSITESYPDILQYVETPTIGVDQCKELANQVWDGLYFGPEIVCTVSEEGNIGPCYGDVGGPLICNDKLGAIISYTVDECGDQYPNVYMRASSYVDWIETQIADATTARPTESTTTPGTTNTEPSTTEIVSSSSSY